MPFMQRERMRPIPFVLVFAPLLLGSVAFASLAGPQLPMRSLLGFVLSMVVLMPTIATGVFAAHMHPPSWSIHLSFWWCIPICIVAVGASVWIELFVVDFVLSVLFLTLLIFAESPATTRSRQTRQ